MRRRSLFVLLLTAVLCIPSCASTSDNNLTVTFHEVTAAEGEIFYANSVFDAECEYLYAMERIDNEDYFHHGDDRPIKVRISDMTVVSRGVLLDGAYRADKILPGGRLALLPSTLNCDWPHWVLTDTETLTESLRVELPGDVCELAVARQEKVYGFLRSGHGVVLNPVTGEIQKTLCEMSLSEETDSAYVDEPLVLEQRVLVTNPVDNVIHVIDTLLDEQEAQIELDTYVWNLVAGENSHSVYGYVPGNSSKLMKIDLNSMKQVAVSDCLPDYTRKRLVRGNDSIYLAYFGNAEKNWNAPATISLFDFSCESLTATGLVAPTCLDGLYFRSDHDQLLWIPTSSARGEVDVHVIQSLDPEKLKVRKEYTLDNEQPNRLGQLTWHPAERRAFLPSIDPPGVYVIMY